MSVIRYCIDTSAVIDLWTRHYPCKRFPRLYKELAVKLHYQACIIDVIYAELFPTEISKLDGSKQALHHWLIEVTKISVKRSDDSNDIYLQLIRHYKSIAGGGGVNSNDLRLIAYAKKHSLAVVTSEKNNPRSLHRQLVTRSLPFAKKRGLDPCPYLICL